MLFHIKSIFIIELLFLRTWYLRGFNAYKINLSVKDFQGLLKIDELMSKHCFNMDVRVHAYNKSKRFNNKKVRS